MPLKRFAIGYAELANDPSHAAQRTYAGIMLRPADDPVDGAKLALAQSRVLGRVLGATFALDRVEGTDAADLAQKVDALAKAGTRLVLVDAPGPVVAELARQTKASGVVLFNVAATDDALRGAECQPNLFDVAPSEAMLTDALAQHAAAHRWRNILVLTGPTEADKAFSDDFQRSAKKFGLSIVANRPFTQNTDPRQRQTNDIPVLTAGSYDLIFVADEDAELGRRLPYASQNPRPVIGTEGLMPAAWHWSAERYGAPQLNQRFEREAGRHMSATDWAAWAATTMILKSAAQAHSTDADAIVAQLSKPDTTVDTYKGLPGSFRSWDHQFREPIMLHTADDVTAIAPLPGFLHPTSYLDTLGVDRPETTCRFDK